MRPVQKVQPRVVKQDATQLPPIRKDIMPASPVTSIPGYYNLKQAAKNADAAKK